MINLFYAKYRPIGQKYTHATAYSGNAGTSPAIRNLTGNRNHTGTEWPFCLAGTKRGSLRITSTTALSQSRERDFSIFTLLTLPSTSTLKRAITVPCKLFSQALTGYTTFWLTNCIKASTPPGYVAGTSTRALSTTSGLLGDDVFPPTRRLSSFNSSILIAPPIPLGLT